MLIRFVPQVLGKAFGGKLATLATGRKWSKAQLWRTLKAVVAAPDGRVPYEVAC
jgi:hypothetical protein